MKKYENDYVVAMEECSEIIQVLSKIMRFGLYNNHPDRPSETNKDDLIKEYYQFQAVMEKIFFENQIKPSNVEIDTIKAKKLDKMGKWLEVSKKEGTIQ